MKLGFTLNLGDYNSMRVETSDYDDQAWGNANKLMYEEAITLLKPWAMYSAMIPKILVTLDLELQQVIFDLKNKK